MPDGADSEFDRERDLTALLALVGQARASSYPHAFLHPGGLQWLLRRLGQATFSVRRWSDGDDLVGVVVDDSGYVIVQGAMPALDRHLWLLEKAEAVVRRSGRGEIEVSAWDDDHDLLAALRALGYAPSGTYGHELVFERANSPREVTLPAGFSMHWLEPDLDDAYVELHRAAWSTWAPSTYDRQQHAAVRLMPDFDRTLVPIVAAPHGALAASCIGWFDPRKRTVEIEPLGTHPEFRRRGLARAVVDEVVRRGLDRGATSVTVWGVNANPAAMHLYESARFQRRRVLREYRRTL